MISAGYIIGVIFGTVAGVTLCELLKPRPLVCLGIGISCAFMFGCLGQVALR